MKKTIAISLANSYYRVVDKDLIFVNSDNKIESIVTKKRIEGEFCNFTFLENKIWGTDNSDLKSKIYSYPEMKFIHQFDIIVNPRIDIFSDLKFGYIFCLCRNYQGKFWARIGIYDFQVIEKYPINYDIYKVINESQFVSLKNSQLHVLGLLDNVEHWQIDISKLGSYVNIHGKREVGKTNKMCIHGNILIAEITGIYILGIDSSNGSILWKHHFNSNLSFSFSTYDGSLHVFSYGTYSQIDILTGELLQIKALETDFKSLGFSVVGHTAPAVSEKYIVLASSFEALAIIIDRTNLQIIQRLELSGNYVPQTNTPKFHDNRLYILDAHNTLHIFEDE